MPFVPDSAPAPSAGRFVPDEAPDTSVFDPHYNNDQAYKTRLALLNARAAQDEELNPKRNPFVEAGDELATAGLQMGPAMVTGAATTPFGPEVQVPMTAAAWALGNRAGHAYRQIRGYENPTGQPLQDALEDLRVGGTGGLAHAIPVGPLAEAGLSKLEPFLNPQQIAAARPLANAVVGGTTNAGISAGAQILDHGDYDPKEVASMGLVGAGLSGLSSAPGTLENIAAVNEPYIRSAAKFGFNGPRADMVDAGKVLQGARENGFVGQNIYELNQWLKGRGPAGRTTSVTPNASTAAEVAPLINPQLPEPTDVSPTELAFVGKAHNESAANSLLAKVTGVSPEELAIRQLAQRMMGKTPEQSVKAIREELKTVEDPEMKKILTDEADRLDNYIAGQQQVLDQQKTQQEAADAQHAAADAQSKAVDNQLAAQQDALKQQQDAIDAQNKAQQDAAKAQQDALDQQQKVQDEATKATQALTNPEPLSMANSGAQVASNIENNPATAQAQLNSITQAPQAPQPPQPNAVQIQGASPQVLGQPTGQPENTLAVSGVGNENKLQNPTGAGEEKAVADFSKQLHAQVETAAKAAQVPEDFSKGDNLYTITGTPVKFVSGAHNQKTAIIEMRDGSTASISRDRLFVEPPSKAQALDFLSTKHQKYSDFVAAAGKRGYDESDGLKQVWDANEKGRAMQKAITAPGVKWQYTVQRPLVPGGKGFIQIDAIKGEDNFLSSNLADLQKAGANLPDVPDWIPQGQYSLKELKALIKKGPPENGVGDFNERDLISGMAEKTKPKHYVENSRGEQLWDKDVVAGDHGELGVVNMNHEQKGAGFPFVTMQNGDNISLAGGTEEWFRPATPAEEKAHKASMKSVEAPPAEEPLPVAKPKGKQQKSANVGRIVKMMGDKLYSSDVSRTTGKELFQNAADQVMKNPEGAPRDIYFGTTRSGEERIFHIADNASGMTPELIMEKFLPAGESGKGVGSAGGLGLAKIAILGGNKQWKVETTARNPEGGFIHTVLKGTGAGYYDYIDNPPQIDIKPGVENQLSDGMTMKFDYIPDNPDTKTGTIVSVHMKNAYDAENFVNEAKEYTPDINFHDVTTADWDAPDPNTALGKAGMRTSYDKQKPKEPYGLVHTIDTPYGSIDIIAPEGAKMQKSNYVWYNVLNRGILQFTGEASHPGGLVLPRGFAVNLKPTVNAEHKEYPFTTNREGLIDAAKQAINSYLAKSGQESLKKMNDLYRNAVRDAPKLSDGSGLVMLDAGQAVDPGLMHEITHDPIIHGVTGDISDIQNSVLDILKKKYPREGFGKAKFRGLLTGGNAYGVHFGGQQADETGIYHDPFLTWRDADEEARQLLHFEYPGASEETIRSSLPEITYKFWRAKTIGIALHEALHQVISEEGEGLARGLTFKAGDIIEAAQNAPQREQVPYEQIYDKLNSYGHALSQQKAPEDAGALIVSQGGYNGYALGDAKDVQAGNGQLARPAGQAPTQAAEAGRAIVPPGTPYSKTEGAPPPPDDTEARRQASYRRQQRGATTSGTLGTVGGAAAGGAYGFMSTKREKDETDEHFQARRLIRAMFFAGGGGLAGGSAARLLMRSPASRDIEALGKIKNESLGVDSMPKWYQEIRQTGPVVKIREALNNSRAIVKDVVGNASQAGHEIPDPANPFAAGKTYGPKVAEAKRQAAVVMDDVQKAIVEAGKKSPMGVENFITRFHTWLEARHTPFYNLHLDDLHQLAGGGGPAPTSRMTDQEAFGVLDQANKDGLEPVFEELSKGYQGIIKSTRDILEQGGLITPETRKAWEQKFPEYVPMNRIPADADTDSAIIGHLGGGPGLSVLNSGVHRIKGSNLDVSDIGGNLMANWNDAIQRVQKNEVDKAAGYFFKNMEFDGTPVPGVEVRKPAVIGTGSGGKPIMERFDPNHMLSYMVKGKPNWVVFHDPKMAMAFSNLNTEGLGGVLRMLANPTRMMARAFTGYNLDFLVPNVLRDRQSAAWKSASQGDFTGALQQINPAKMVGDPAIVANWVFQKQSPDTAMFQQMMDDGGMPGGYASSTRDQAHQFVEGLRRADQNPASWTIQHTKKAFNFLSEISEGATRFRAYKRALDLGASRQEAAVAALNSSIDFNMKGTKTNQLGALYAFFNPAQQGAVNTVKNIMRSKDAMVSLMAGLMGLNAATDAWNSSIDPQWKSRKAFQFARTNGVPVIYGKDPQTKELKYFTIPIAQDLRPVKAIADFTLEMGNGEIKSGDNLQNELARVGGAVVNAANPLGASPLDSPLTTLAPTVARPLLEVQTNRDYADRPIVPDEKNTDRFIQDQAKRNLSSYDSRTGRMAIAISDMLKKYLNMEVSPERMKYLMNAYSGGPGKLASSAINAPETTAQDFKASNLPVVDSFVRRSSSEGLEKSSPLYQRTIQQLSDVKTADELTRQHAKVYFNKTFDKIDPKRWGEYWRAANKAGLMPKDITFRRSLMTSLMDKAKGRGDLDNLVSQFAVENGERAAYYADRRKDFKTEQEYLTFLDEQRKKGLVTAPMVPQIRFFLNVKK